MKQINNKAIVCEWCGLSYPKSFCPDNYWVIDVFLDKHIICNDCKNHLKKIKVKFE